LTLALTGSISAVVTGTAGTATVDLVNAVADKWLAKNPTALARLWDVATTTSKITFTARDKGTSQIGGTLAFTASLASSTLSNVGYIIGNDLATATNSTADNVAHGQGIVITMLADTPGSTLSEIGSPGSNHALASAGNASVTASGVTVVELTSTRDISASDSGLNVPNVDMHPTESRSDVVNPYETIAAATSTATTFNRVSWL